MSVNDNFFSDKLKNNHITKNDNHMKMEFIEWVLPFEDVLAECRDKVLPPSRHAFASEEIYFADVETVSTRGMALTGWARSPISEILMRSVAME